ncbi:MAG: ABC transporter permease [Candidatus Schekmanbacteria bacterium]|nr:ABC transporter permease [Candidatus Schekmanbacteria bacterium]
MHKIAIVAWREFKSTALTKAFILSAVAAPVLMGAMAIYGPRLFASKIAPLKGQLAIVDPTGRLLTAARVEFQRDRLLGRLRDELIRRTQVTKLPGNQTLGPTAPNPAAGESSPEALITAGLVTDVAIEVVGEAGLEALPRLQASLGEGSLVAVAVYVPPAEVPATSAAAPAGDQRQEELTLYVQAQTNIRHSSVIEDTLATALSRIHIEAAGLSVERVRELSRAPLVKTVRINDEGKQVTEDRDVKVFRIVVPMIFMMLVWMGSFMSGNYLLTLTIEEKSNKVMEVLLSAVSPLQLMAGKIIGQAFVGLVMLSVYIAAGIAALVAFAFVDLINWTDLIYVGLYYIMAYFMIAAIMAAVGSAVNELREAQALMLPAALVLMVPLLLWLPISESPNGVLATVTSFVPLMTPFVMIVRITSTEPVALWQIALSLVEGYAASVAMVWVAARVFRIGVLMYGKPPSPWELWKWMRAS